MKSTLLVSAILAAAPLVAQVKITQGSDRILIEIDGKPSTDFFISSSVPKPYLHPLRTASGKIVTRGYPMEMIEGESRDHPHHRGLWFSHGEVNGIDFWANEPSQKVPLPKGKIITKRVLDLKSGKKSGIVNVLFDWVDKDDQVLLNENRLMTFYSHPTQRMIDFDIKLTAVQKVNFGDTKEGTFAIRLATPLEERKGHAKMINAEGLEGEKQVWGKRSNWVDYSGEVDGETVGIVIMDHPTNPRHPTFWHSRAYGLFAANPFGEHEFLGEKEKRAGLTIQPGETLRFRYRVIIHPGDSRSLNLAEMYQKYAAIK